MYRALYRKYRPQIFEDVCDQKHIVDILKNEVKTGKISHAYLFCGSRGTGKTTCAKILAKAINCLNPKDGSPCGECAACKAVESGIITDIVEMDAASNNGVDDIRILRDEVVYPPSELKKRVYIIDEVHALSPQAYNALLKTLEEPPSHVVFILATTELQKLPATIISRCQRFDFKRLSIESIVSRLSYVAKCEGLDITDEAIYLMARAALGGMRDALGYLELCAGLNTRLDEETVSGVLGVTMYDDLLKTADAAAGGDYETLLEKIDDVYKKSNDLSVFWYDLAGVFRDLLLIKTTKNYERHIEVSRAQLQKLEEVAARLTAEQLLYDLRTMNDALQVMQKNTSQKRIIAEMAIIKLSDPRLDTGTDALAARISVLERHMRSGAVPTMTETSPIRALKEPVQATPDEKTITEPTAKDTAPTAPARKATAKPPAAGQKELTPAKYWPDVVSELQRGDSSAIPYTNDTRGYTSDDGKFYILVKSAFTVILAERNKKKLADAINQYADTVYSEFDLVIKDTASAEKDQYRILDDLIASGQAE